MKTLMLSLLAITAATPAFAAEKNYSCEFGVTAFEKETFKPRLTLKGSAKISGTDIDNSVAIVTADGKVLTGSEAAKFMKETDFVTYEKPYLQVDLTDSENGNPALAQLTFLENKELKVTAAAVYPELGDLVGVLSVMPNSQGIAYSFACKKL